MTLCFPFEALQFLFESSAVLFWKIPSTHTGLHRKHGTFYWQIPTPLYTTLISVSRIYVVISSGNHGILWRELVLTIWNMYLEENASSLWKKCNVPSNIQPSVQISRWGSFVYIVAALLSRVPLSKEYGISWRMCKTSSLFSK